MLIEGWGRQSNMQRPHRALGYRPPSPETRTVTPVSFGVTELTWWPNTWGRSIFTREAAGIPARLACVRSPVRLSDGVKVKAPSNVIGW